MKWRREKTDQEIIAFASITKRQHFNICPL